MERADQPTRVALGERERNSGARDAGRGEEDPGEAVGDEHRLTEAEPGADRERSVRVSGRGCDSDSADESAGVGRDVSGRARAESGSGENSGDESRVADGEHDAHAAASRVTTPAASSSPCRMAIGAGGEPGT